MRTVLRTSATLLLAAGCAALAPTTAEAQAEDDWAVGDWSGVLQAGPQRLDIVYHVARGEDGALTGTMDVPTQGAAGIPLSEVTVDGMTLIMTFPVPGGGRYEGTYSEANELIEGSFTQGGQSFPMPLSRGIPEGIVTAPPPPPTPARPQDPTPPYPYEAVDVTVPNAEAGVELAGTLTIPEGDGPFPGAILVSGSGPQNRDEALMGHRPFLVLADHLTRAGIAVLRYDDRGIAGSTGDFSAATSEDFASDALAALAFLAARPEVDAQKVGIIGHSEGGLVGPMAAARSASVGFVVMLAGPGVPGLDVLVEQGRLIGKAQGAPDAVVEVNAAVQTALAAVLAQEPDPEAARPLLEAEMRRLTDELPPEWRAAAGPALSDEGIARTVAQVNSPWFRFFLAHDPRPDLEKVGVPVLAIVGEKDLQVPHYQNMPEIEAAFERGGNPDATVRVLPGLNHLFQLADTGSPSEYQQIPQTMSPTALDLVSGWIVERFGR